MPLKHLQAVHHCNNPLCSLCPLPSPPTTTTRHSPTCSSLLRRQGSTGWLSGTGCMQGSGPSAPPAAPAPAAKGREAVEVPRAGAGARVIRCVMPTMEASAREMPMGYTSWKRVENGGRGAGGKQVVNRWDLGC